MPGSATDYLRQRVLGNTLGFAPFTMPAAIFVGLTTSLPSASTPGAEIPVAGYQRSGATFGMSSGRTDLASNLLTLEWPPATADWGNVGWFELWDASTGGNRLYWGPITDPATGAALARTVLAGDLMRIQAGNLTVQAI